jgi:hypothetical protein
MRPRARFGILTGVFTLVLMTTAVPAARAERAGQEVPPSGGQGRGGRGNQPIVLNADDVAAFPEPPADIRDVRDGIARGHLAMIEYDSKTVGTKRRMHVYTPSGYSQDTKYPVLYLLHGIGGDEQEWQRVATLNVLPDKPRRRRQSDADDRRDAQRSRAGERPCRRQHHGCRASVCHVRARLVRGLIPAIESPLRFGAWPSR